MTFPIATLDVQKIGVTRFLCPDDESGYPIMNSEVGDRVIEALPEFAGRSCYQSFAKKNPNTHAIGDYLAHLLDQHHYSVLEHSSVSFYIQGVSRALTHELVRHRHFSYSQLSQRYVDSSDVRFVIPPALEGNEIGIAALRRTAVIALGSYNEIVDDLMGKGLKRKQAREAARAALPNMTETKIVVTGNFRAWIEFLVKRDNPAADAEIRRLAAEIGRQLSELAPHIFGSDARERWDDSAAQKPAAA